MEITLDQIKALRDKTGVSISACKKALVEAEGNEQTAIELLRKKGEAKAVERGDRATGEGVVASYIHGNGKIGVLLQLGCETDFVARNEDFVQLARDIAMHVAASDPLYIDPSEVSTNLLDEEREIWKAQLMEEGKPADMLDKILMGKETKFRDEVSLLRQPYVKNPEQTIEKLLSEAVLRLGENIKIVAFTRYSF
ncbi:elongation factor Ts [Candidatus Peregrinibacteria bacterium CG_4_9_14_0_2_um_filter_53_11]|nr:MAG: elongation factor Ts [Candidatus Peregrinibacteria bacterium CG_4_9_14_0_2_um_filter_53_11]